MKKITVTMWDLSWFNLLHTLEMSKHSLNDSQYKTSFIESPAGSDRFMLNREVVNINTRAIVSEIAHQTGFAQTVKDSTELHRRIDECASGSDKTYTEDEIKKLNIG